MHHSSDSGTKREDNEQTPSVAMIGTGHHIQCERHDDTVVFRCEACGREIHDLRAVYLAHRPGTGWRIECSAHPDAEHAMDAGHLFGGGLRSLELFADLARARWFVASELFEALTRLRAQSRGVYRTSVTHGALAAASTRR